MLNCAGSMQRVEVGFQIWKAEGCAGCSRHCFEDKQHYRARNQWNATCEETSDGAEVEAYEFVFVPGEWVSGTEQD